MDENSKGHRRRVKLILSDHENLNVDEFFNRQNKKVGKRNGNLDDSQSSGVGGQKKSLGAVSTCKSEIGSKKRKINDGSLTVSAEITEEVHYRESDEPSAAISYPEVSSSGKERKKESKLKKRRYQKDADDEAYVPINATAEFSTDGRQEQSKMNERKKSKRDKHLVFISPSVTINTIAELSTDGNEELSKMKGRKKKSKRDRDLVFISSSSVTGSDFPESTEGSQKTRDVRTEVSMVVTTQKSDLEPRQLNSKAVQNVRETTNEEVAVSSTSGIVDDLRNPEEEGTRGNSKKSRKIKEGRNGKVVTNKSAVYVELPDVEKPTKTKKKKKSRTEEELIDKDSKSSVNCATDKHSADKENNTKMTKKRTAKADRTHAAIAATQPLSETPHDNNPVQLHNEPTGATVAAYINSSETDDEGEMVYESPKKKRKSMRIAHMETTEERNEQVTGSAWLKQAKSNAGIPRPNKNLFRRKMRCPVDGCLGRSTRMNRHLLDCHPELEASDREKLMESITENPCNFLGPVPCLPVVPVLKRKLRCPVEGCFGETIRLRRHLITCHSELTPAERDELWDKVSQNSTEYLCSLSKDSDSESEENNTVVRAKKSSAGIPRPNFKVRSRRIKQNCIVVSCHGAVINMRRHLVDCHSDIADEHEQLLEKLVEQRRELRAAMKEALKQRSRCSGSSVKRFCYFRR